MWKKAATVSWFIFGHTEHTNEHSFNTCPSADLQECAVKQLDKSERMETEGQLEKKTGLEYGLNNILPEVWGLANTVDVQLCPYLLQQN